MLYVIRRTLILSVVLTLFAGVQLSHSFCLIRGGLGGPGNREDCCENDPSQWRPDAIPVPLWINEDTDPDLWDGIYASYDGWEEVTSAYLAIVDSGFTPIDYVNTGDGVNVVSFSQDPGIFPPGSTTLAFTSGNWGVNIGGDYTITGFDVIFNDVGYDWGWPPAGGELSVKGVTIHEIGHALGMAHCWQGGPPGCGPDCQGSTMWGFISGNGVSDESLELDDIMGLTLAYPRWLFTGTLTESGSGLPIANAEVLVSTAAAKDTLVYGSLPDPLPGNGSACAGYVGGPVLTDQDGTFEFAVMEPSFTATFFRSGYNPDSLEISFTGIDTIDVSVSLDESSLSSLQGTLKDAETQDPILGAIVLMQNGTAYDTVFTSAQTGEFSFDNIPVSQPPFVVYTGVEILAVLPYPFSTVIDTVIEVDAGTPAEIDLTLLPADVLLVDDDSGESYENYYIPEIEASGRSYVRFDVAEREESPIAYFDLFPSPMTVVWFTGDDTDSTITIDELDSLATLFDSGLKLFLTGQNILEDLWEQDSIFVRNEFDVSYAGNIANSISFGRGFPGVPIGRQFEKILLAGNSGANNQTSKDIVVSHGDGFGIFHYTSSPVDTTNLGTAGVAAEDLGAGGEGRIVFLGFGFEALNRPNPADSSIASRTEVMQAILDWLEDVPTGIEDGGTDRPAGLPRAFALEQNYPNPFNPQTSIRFSIPVRHEGESEKERVTLSVFNLRGQMIAELLDDELSPGTYTVHWEGTDRMGNQVPSGVYFYKLSWGDESYTRKMVLIK